MIQILHKFLFTILQQKKLLTKTKIPLQTQLKIIPLLSHKHLKHTDLLIKIMTHLPFHLNLQLPTILMILLNKVLLMLNTQIQSIFKHQLLLHLLKYKLQLILQLKTIQNVQTGLNINTIHSNPPFKYTTSRQLSRPPLQPILTNPLSYNLTSTNSSHIQQSSTKPNTINSLNNTPPSQSQSSNTLTPTLQNSQFQIPNPPSTTIRTNPYFHNTSTTSFTNISNIPTYNTVQPSTVSQNTIPQPTYINSSTSISEPIEPFDGLDHNYTPEEYLQQLEARVTFSLGLQPTLEHECKFWHARRMAFIQYSLTGTALSWYIRLSDTYKQDWHAFVHAFKKQFFSQKNAYYAQVDALNLSKQDNETVRHFALKVQQLVKKGWRNENASTINLECNEIFTKGLPKNLRDFVKHK